MGILGTPPLTQCYPFPHSWRFSALAALENHLGASENYQHLSATLINSKSQE